MRQLIQKLINDQNGMILSSEVVLVGTILVLGSIVGLAAISRAVTHELNDIANACQGQGSRMYGGGNPNDTQDSDYYTATDSQGVPEMAGY